MYTRPDKNIDIESKYVPVNDPKSSSVPPTGMEPMYKTLREIEKLNPNNPDEEKKLNPKYKMRDVDIISPEDIKQYQNYRPKNYKIPYKTEPDVEFPSRRDYYDVGPTGKVEESSESSKKPSVTENIPVEEPEPKRKDKKHKSKKEPVDKHKTSKKEPTKIIPPDKKHKNTQPTQPSTNPNDIKPIQKRESIVGKEPDININEPEKPVRPKINTEEFPQDEQIQPESEKPEMYDTGIIPGIGKKKVESGEEIGSEANPSVLMFSSISTSFKM